MLVEAQTLVKTRWRMWTGGIEPERKRVDASRKASKARPFLDNLARDGFDLIILLAQVS